MERVGGVRGRALGPWGRGSAPSSGGRGCGPGPLAAASRRRPQPGNTAGARRGLWGRRVPGPARPCPPPARHARLRLQVPGEAQAAAAVPTVREAHARARAGVYLRPPLLRHLPAGVPQVRPGGGGPGPAVPGVPGAAWGRARAGDTSGLCLHGRPVTSGAPTPMSRGGSDVRAPGRTPRTPASGRSGPTCPAPGGQDALPDPWPALPPPPRS